MRRSILKFAHLHIWRRLPRGVRRAALLHGSAWLAPRIAPDAKPEAPIIVVGPLRAASGLGVGARACHDAVKKAGLSVYGVDLTRALLQDEDFPDFAFEDGGHLIGAGTIFLHVGGPLVPLALLRLGRDLVSNKRIVAHWVWELPQMPSDWRLGVPFVHEIWTPSQFAADAIRAISRDRPIHVLPHPIDSPVGWPKRRAPNNQHQFTALVILNIASSFERKNPCAAIKAFRKAFGEDPNARLIVKYTNALAYPKAVPLMMEEAGRASNIIFISDTIDTAGMDSLYAEADVVMSLHRAEGFGLVIAESMLRGIPVIATDWSGNRDFLTSETGVPISYSLVPAKDPQDTYDHPSMRWANANIDHVAEALKTLRADFSLRVRIGAAARAHATALFSPKTYGENIKRLLCTP
jgi:glycosyltransferase involved in cell wall biosynthesis